MLRKKWLKHKKFRTASSTKYDVEDGYFNRHDGRMRNNFTESSKNY